MMRRYGNQREAGRTYVMRPGVYCIMPFKGQILLTHQMEPEPEIQLPGGGIDPGESTLTALHREVFEETGWRVGNSRRLTSYRHFIFMPEYDLWAEKICHIYYAQPIRAHGPPTESGHTALMLPLEMAIDALPGPGQAEVLQGFFEGRFGSFRY